MQYSVTASEILYAVLWTTFLKRCFKNEWDGEKKERNYFKSGEKMLEKKMPASCIKGRQGEFATMQEYDCNTKHEIEENSLISWRKEW